MTKKHTGKRTLTSGAVRSIAMGSLIWSQAYTCSWSLKNQRHPLIFWQWNYADHSTQKSVKKAKKPVMITSPIIINPQGKPKANVIGGGMNEDGSFPVSPDAFSFDLEYISGGSTYRMT
ncbi:hypothetical protein K438DRAFT_1765972 [Mycena galopus ATCC 62051]|nr:hypothetical protein K438DRAFT_1765972 [Mycena galopus ATCC 62051]